MYPSISHVPAAHTHKPLWKKAKFAFLFILLGLFVLVGLMLGVPSQAAEDEWLWHNPLPEANILTDVSYLSASFCKAVGGAGTLLSWDGTEWTIDDTGIDSFLEGVSCVSTTFCKAAGSLADGTTDLRSWNGRDKLDRRLGPA
jgi:hypothetical protein